MENREFVTAQCVVPYTEPPRSDAAPADAAAPDASLPDAPPHWTFTSAGDIAAWLAFTNGSGCQLSTLAVESASFARLVSNDLPCTGGCMYPGFFSQEPVAVEQSAGFVTNGTMVAVPAGAARAGA